jgi:hypothetical protein
VSLPDDLADVIQELRPRTGPGFGSVRVEAVVGPCTWRTSLFPDKERRSAVRRAAGLEDGSRLHVELTLL